MNKRDAIKFIRIREAAMNQANHERLMFGSMEDWYDECKQLHERIREQALISGVVFGMACPKCYREVCSNEDVTPGRTQCHCKDTERAGLVPEIMAALGFDILNKGYGHSPIRPV